MKMTRSSATGLARLVAMNGHEVITAATLSEGMDRLGAAPSHLVTDLNLPDGLGTTLLRHVRAGQMPVKVAVLSGADDAALMGRSEVAAPPKSLFRKPPDWDAVLRWIGE